MAKKKKDKFNNDTLEIIGARVHNLQNIDLSIPRNKLVVITGISGSGKSSLAFDTIYAEGQRRYLETFSAYARQFMGEMERPDVEKITGLSPVISIEQKTTGRSPRSTVGTITEIYDFLRLLFARTATAYSYVTGKKMIRYSEDQMVQHILDTFSDKKIIILAPIVRARKGHYREVFEQLRNQGYTKVRVDKEIIELKPFLRVDRYKTHDIELVVDRLKAIEDRKPRLQEAVNIALEKGKGLVMVIDHDSQKNLILSKDLMCPESGISYEEPSPNAFSFNSPYGACPKCNGLGKLHSVDIEKVIPDDNITLKNGGIAPFGEYKDTYAFKQLKKIGKKYNFTLDAKINEIPQEGLDMILYGPGGKNSAHETSFVGDESGGKYYGLVSRLIYWFKNSSSEKIKQWAEKYLTFDVCDDCNGMRLNKNSLHFKIAEKNISELANLDIEPLIDWFTEINSHFTERQQLIATDIVKEIMLRLSFLQDVGLNYLNLNRQARTLSGGESQRIRLASQIGSKLTGITYILDEPSIGLHQNDNQKLIEALKELTEIGNSVLVVEHDKDIMLASDYLIDIGPGAGKHGGVIVGEGKPSAFKKMNTITADYLNGKRKIEIPKKRRKGSGEFLELKGATGNNLNNVNIKIPLGTLTLITGVSGSGKSTLINETLYPIIRKEFYRSLKKPMPYKSIKGIENIDKIVEIDQKPIGRTPRSNPATYTGIFTPIRKLFSDIPEAKIRGYKPGRFSFNVKGGRCEECRGGGQKVIEMNFLPDVLVDCDTCFGQRYNRQTLEIRFKGKSITDVLNMTVDEAENFFKNIPNIHRKLVTYKNVGLGYITLGQQATTLSGGEAQRVKLSEELSKKSTGKTLYILDEPTTGLHFQDISLLLSVLNQLVDKGNTVLVIEHNLDVVKVADYIFDLGPGGGKNGGNIVAHGTPEKIIKVKESLTGKHLILEMQ